MLKWLNRISKLETKVDNILRFGVIKEVDTANNQVVVSFGDGLESPSIPYFVNSSGNATVYFIPKIGDQCMILSQSGEISKAVAMPSIYKGNVAGGSDEWRLEFAQGSIVYKEGKLEIKANTEVNIESSKVNIKSDQIVLGDDSGGEVVCKMHTCSFSGNPHSVGSSKIKGAM